MDDVEAYVEHLNNTPVHVIAALLEHRGLYTMMIYPGIFVEGHRASMRGLYTEICDADVLRTPTAEAWAAFAASGEQPSPQYGTERTASPSWILP